MSSFADKHLKKKSWLSHLLWGASLIYRFVVAAKRKKAAPLKIKGVKIVGVGNIVCGGSGKTPFDVALARCYQEKKVKVAISVRGYKSRLESSATLISDRKAVLPQAKMAGDEPQLLAQMLPGVPVVVGKDRQRAVRLLLDKFKDLEVVILEDSFQNFKLAHDFDFVLFKAKVGVGNGWCLPAGYLREGEEALADADCIVLDGDNPSVERLAKRYKKQLVKGEIVPRGFFDADGNKVSIEKLRCGRCYSLSAIADPTAFEQMVENFGVRLAKRFSFADHHHLQGLPKKRLAQAEFLVVTDKDLVKLSTDQSLRSKLVTLRIDYKVDFEAVRGLW